MVSAQILKHLLPRFFQPCFKVVPLILVAILQVDADGKSVSYESYNQLNACFYRLQQVRLPDIKFNCVEFFSAFHNGLICILYNSLQEMFKFPSGFITIQNCYALIYGWSLQPLNQQSKCVRDLR